MKLQKRTIKGHKLPKKELVPGVIYGKGQDPVSIQVNRLEITNMFHKKGFSQTFEVTLDGKKQLAYFKDVQVQRMNQHLLQHFDLMTVIKGDTMTAKIRVTFLNKESVEKQGFIINPVDDTVEIEYQAGAGINHLDVDCEGLGENDSIKASSIVLPEGITLLSNPEAVILSVALPKEEVEPVEGEEEILEVESIKQSSE